MYVCVGVCESVCVYACLLPEYLFACLPFHLPECLCLCVTENVRTFNDSCVCVCVYACALCKVGSYMYKGDYMGTNHPYCSVL